MQVKYVHMQAHPHTQRQLLLNEGLRKKQTGFAEEDCP